MGDQYVMRLMKGKCTFGSMDNYLNIPLDHGVRFGVDEQPVLNANDHVAGEHVIHFGTCSSNANPGNAVRSFAKAFIPGASLISGVMDKLGCTGCKCTPMTFLPWMNTNEENIIEGAPALTTESKLACFYGGVISIVKEEAATSEEAPPEEASEPLVQAKSISQFGSIRR